MAVQINVAANQAALAQSIAAGVQAYNQRFANQNQINLQVNARGFTQPLGRITGDVKDFEAALAASNARVIAFGASTAILGGIIRGFKSIAEVTVEVEKNLTDINRVFGLTTRELQKFSTDLFNVSKQTATSFKDASQAALEFSRQGVKAEQVLQRTADALSLARIAGMNVSNAIEALTATVNGFAATGITTSEVLNKLVAVEQSYAVSAGDLAEALSRTGLAAQEAGVSIDELNALVTAAQEKTARGGAVIGNALKTIFTRLQRTETLDQLEQFNIAVRDVQGNILPATAILKNFAAGYTRLADAQRSQLSEQVAGVYQVNILKAIVSDLNSTQGAYAGALLKGTNATNEAEIATAKLNQSLDALLTQTTTVAQQFANNVGKVTFEPLAKYTLETFKSLFENLNQILEGEGMGSTFAVGLLKGIRNVLMGPGAIGAFFVLAKLLQNSFSYLTQALPQIVGITTETQNRKNIESAILQILQGQGVATQALLGQMGNEVAQAKLLLQIARDQTHEYQTQQKLVKSLSPVLARQGVTVAPGGGGGLRVTRSRGFIPNFEEASAKASGATGSVSAVAGIGTIGGKSFIANNQEIQFPNFAGSGDTAVIPTYGGGMSRAISMIANGQSGPILTNRGFIPNFAKEVEIVSRGEQRLALEQQKIQITPDNKGIIVTPNSGFRLSENGKTVFWPDGRQAALSQILNARSTGGKALAGRTSEVKNLASNLYDRESVAGGNSVAKTFENMAQQKFPSLKSLHNEGINFNLKPSGKSGAYVDFYDAQLKKFVEVKGGSEFSESDIITKFQRIREDLTNQLMLQLNNSWTNRLIYNSDNKPKWLSAGFIPNFAPFNITKNLGFAGDQHSLTLPSGSFIRYSHDKEAEQLNLKYIESSPGAREGLTLWNKLVTMGQKLKVKKGIYSESIAAQNDKIRDLNTDNIKIPDVLRKAFPQVFYRQAGKSKSSSLDLMISDSGYGVIKKQLQGKNIFDLLIAETKKNYGSDVMSLIDSITHDAFKITNLRDTLSKGFLPNFAYQNAVMQLEENLSGQNAILDTTTGPFPFIRNSGQPNFAAAIKDHGGLNNALSDSYRNQVGAGLMSNGFIPNFGGMRRYRRQLARNQRNNQDLTQVSSDPAQIEREINAIATQTMQKIKNAFLNLAMYPTYFIIDPLEEGLDNVKNKLQGGFDKIKNVNLKNLFPSSVTSPAAAKQTAQNAPPVISPNQGKSFFTGVGESLSRVFSSPALAVLLPTITSAIASEFQYGGKQRYELTESQRMKQSFANQGVTAISTGAFIGTSIAPGVGTAIGAAAGGIYAFINAMDDAKLSITEFKDSITEISQKQTSAITDYRNNLEQLSKATEAGDQKLIDKLTNDLATSLSALSSKNLNLDLQNKSVKDLDILISDINKRAAIASSILAGTEKLSTGAEDVSFLDRFKQQAGETFINIVDKLRRAVVILSDEISKSFNSILTNLTEPISIIKDMWSNLMDLFSSSISYLGFKLESIFDSIFFSADENEKRNNEISLQQSKEMMTRSAENLGGLILKSIVKSVNYGVDSGMLSNALVGVNPFAALLEKGVIEKGGARTIQSYNMSDVVKEFMTKGGGGGATEFYKRIFALGAKGEKGQMLDEQIFSTLKTIAETGPEEQRQDLLNTLREILVQRGVEGQDIDIFLQQVTKLTQTGEYKGQFVAANFKDFLQQLTSLDTAARALAQRQALDTKNFTQIKNDIQNSIRDYVNQSALNQIAINGQIQQQKVLLSERGRIGDVFGKPFESAGVRQQERMLDITSEFQRDLNTIGLDTTKIIDQLRTKVIPQRLEDIQVLTQDFTTEDYTPEQRIDLLKQFVNQPKLGFTQEQDRQEILNLIKAQEQILKQRQAQNKNDIATAQLIFDIENRKLIQARDFSFQLKAGVLSLSDEADLMLGQLGRKIPGAFADGMTAALMQVAKGTSSIGDAFKNIAIDFGQMLMQEVMRAAIGKVLGNVFSPLFSQTGGVVGKQKGGIVYAANGGLLPGSRIGDRNLAYLEDGEYIINSNAAKKFGIENLDAINYGMFPRFQSGGGFGMAPQVGMVNNEYDYTGQLMQSNAPNQAINYEDYTAYAYSEDEYFKKTREKAVQAEQERIQKLYQDRVKNLQLMTSIMGAVGSIALGAGMSGLASGAAKTASQVGNAAKQGVIQGASDVGKKAVEQFNAGEITSSQLTKLIKVNPSAFTSTFSGSFANAGLKTNLFGNVTNRSLGNLLSTQGFNPVTSSSFAGNLLQSGLGNARSFLPRQQTGGLVGYQTGGYIPYGSRISDNIPRYMSGGMNVMNNSANQKYMMQSAPRFSAGGSNGSVSNTTNNNSNSTNIAINIDKSGNTVIGQSGNNYSNNEYQFSQQLAKVVSKIADSRISDARRSGGELSKRTG